VTFFLSDLAKIHFQNDDELISEIEGSGGDAQVVITTTTTTGPSTTTTTGPSTSTTTTEGSGNGN